MAKIPAKILFAVPAAAFAAAAAFFQSGLARERKTALEAIDNTYSSNVPAETRAAVAMLGGLRGVASEFLRLHASRLQREGEFASLAQLSMWLVQLDPHSPETWSMAAWNLSYNLSASCDDPADKWRWVVAGMKLLRDDALEVNPREPKIYYELVWLFLNKVNGTLDETGAYYNSSWRKTVSAAMEGDGPESLKMDPALMRDIDSKYGKLDWTDPVSSAIYWGEAGMRACAPSAMRTELRKSLCLCLFAKIRAEPRYADKALEVAEREYAAEPSPVHGDAIRVLRDFIAGGYAPLKDE